ncbi:hypothetical protein POM88_001637 [Heracleum sosnowskyi]|uniref:Replication factor A C-terminal domain-containing protein n=1 Tax=Heracleum sosnowskyi TaxID=360622 RepID=A0AAD8NAK9_9APIA|nr:hypothetical protein POM88_001637 [Heracleum sosnowskyi]
MIRIVELMHLLMRKYVRDWTKCHKKCKLVKQDVPHLAEYAFDLFPLEDVEKFIIDNRFLLDVIGIVDTNTPIIVYSKDDPKKSHLKFKITDGRYKLNITFFNEIGESFEKAFKDILEEPVVVIIAGGKANKYDGELYLTSFPATRFYLNPNNYSVPEVLNRFTFMNCEDETDTKLYTIEDIKQLNEAYIEKQILCALTVKKVEQQYNWYDNFCTNCDEEVNIVDGRFRCIVKCKRNIPLPDKRFRLCTVCSDNTGVIVVVFPDDEIQRITGKNVFEIENDDNQVVEDILFPPLLKDFEKKEYIVTLNISEENIRKSSNVYQAKKLLQPQEMGESCNTVGLTSPQKVYTPVTTEIQASEAPKEYSPPTEKSTNRTRGRKNKVFVKYDMDEATPIAKLKKT